MSAREELVRDNERKREACSGRILAAEYKLGLYAYEHKDSLSLKIGSKLLDEIINRSIILESARREDSEAEAEKKRAEADAEHLAELERDLKREEKEEDSLEERLGAALFEQASFGLLDKDIFGRIYQDLEKEKALSGRQGLLSGINYAGWKKRETQRFRSYAEDALRADEGLFSGKGASLIRTLKEKRSLIFRMRADYDGLRKKKHRNDSHKATAGSKKEDLDKSIASYGAYLYEKGGVWVDETTPEPMLDLLSLLLELHGELASIAAERTDITKAAKAEDVSAMIAIEEGKIAILEKEKSRLDAEISAINDKILRLRGKLDSLR